eukprot:4162314-Amphidinium_carterae.1
MGGDCVMSSGSNWPTQRAKRLTRTRMRFVLESPIYGWDLARIKEAENVYIRVACHTAVPARGLGYGGGGLKDLPFPSCKDMFAKYKAGEEVDLVDADHEWSVDF